MRGHQVKARLRAAEHRREPFQLLAAGALQDSPGGQDGSVAGTGCWATEPGMGMSDGWRHLGAEGQAGTAVAKRGHSSGDLKHMTFQKVLALAGGPAAGRLGRSARNCWGQGFVSCVEESIRSL